MYNTGRNYRSYSYGGASRAPASTAHNRGALPARSMPPRSHSNNSAGHGRANNPYTYNNLKAASYSAPSQQRTHPNRAPHNSYGREFSDVGSESSPVKRQGAVGGSNANGGGGHNAARQLRNLRPPPHNPPQPMRNNYMGVTPQRQAAGATHHQRGISPSPNNKGTSSVAPYGYNSRGTAYAQTSYGRGRGGMGRARGIGGPTPTRKVAPLSSRPPFDPRGTAPTAEATSVPARRRAAGPNGASSTAAYAYGYRAAGRYRSPAAAHVRGAVQPRGGAFHPTNPRRHITYGDDDHYASERHNAHAEDDVDAYAHLFEGAPDHPLYTELKALGARKAAALVKLTGEKHRLAAAGRELREAAAKEAAIADERTRLEAKLRAAERQKERIDGVSGPAEAKAALLEKTAALQIVKDEYQCTMAAMRQLEGGNSTTGGGGGSNGRRAASSSAFGGDSRRGGGGLRSASYAPPTAAGRSQQRLQQSLDERRLRDEELLCAKHEAQCRKLQEEMGEMRAYVGQLTAAAEEAARQQKLLQQQTKKLQEQQRKSEGGGGSDSDTAIVITVSAAESANTTPTRQRAEGHGTPAFLTAVPADDSPTQQSPTRARIASRIAERRADIERMRAAFEAEERALDLRLRDEAAKSEQRHAIATDQLANAAALSGARKDTVQSLRAAVSAKTAAAAQKRSEADSNRRRMADLLRQCEELQQKADAAAEALKAGGQRVEAARVAHATTMSEQVKQQQMEEAKTKRTMAELLERVAAETKRAAGYASEREKIVKKTKASLERWAQQDAARRKILEGYERAKAHKAEAQQSLDELKAQHQRELSDAAYASQKKDVIADLRGQYDKESLRLADLERQNAQLEKALGATVDLLKRNNVEVMF